MHSAAWVMRSDFRVCACGSVHPLCGSLVLPPLLPRVRAAAAVQTAPPASTAHDRANASVCMRVCVHEACRGCLCSAAEDGKQHHTHRSVRSQGVLRCSRTHGAPCHAGRTVMRRVLVRVECIWCVCVKMKKKAREERIQK